LQHAESTLRLIRLIGTDDVKGCHYGIPVLLLGKAMFGISGSDAGERRGRYHAPLRELRSSYLVFDSFYRGTHVAEA